MDILMIDGFVFWSCFRVKQSDGTVEQDDQWFNDDWLFSGDSGRVLVLYSTMMDLELMEQWIDEIARSGWCFWS